MNHISFLVSKTETYDIFLKSDACETAKVKIKKPTDEVDTNPSSVGFLFLYPIQFCLTREGLELLVWVRPTSSCGQLIENKDFSIF